MLKNYIFLESYETKSDNKETKKMIPTSSDNEETSLRLDERSPKSPSTAWNVNENVRPLSKSKSLQDSKSPRPELLGSKQGHKSEINLVVNAPSDNQTCLKKQFSICVTGEQDYEHSIAL